MSEETKTKTEDKKSVSKVMTTTKKVKVIGKAEYTNNSTGEVEIMDVVSVEDRDFNFHKLWLGHILQSIDLIGNQKTKLAFWILDHLDSENKFIYTYEEIRKETKISSKTIADTFKALVNSNFLKKKQSGVYIVNPDFIYKGTRKGRLNVLIQYREAERTEAIKAKEKADKAESETTTESTASDTAVTDTKITGTITGTMFTPVEVATDTTTATVTPRPGKRPGKAGTPKPTNWQEIKSQILAGEITKKSVWQSLKIASNTLNKWLAE